MKIWIIGTPGSGKTYLAEILSLHYNLTHIELDALVWERNWQRASESEICAKYKKLSYDIHWVCDGNYAELIPHILSDADILLWVNTSFVRSFYQALFRSIKRIFAGEILWNGNKESLYTLFKFNGMFWYSSLSHIRIKKDLCQIYDIFPGPKIVVNSKQQFNEVINEVDSILGYDKR